MDRLEAYERRLAELAAAVDAARKAVSPAPARPAVQADGAIDPTAVAFNVFASLLATDGLRAALYALLRRSDYRFVSIFRFKDGMATSVVHVDREDLALTQAAEVPDTATYCSYVRAAQAPFVTVEAGEDARTEGHAAREVVPAYCGIPLYTPEGDFLGTLCFYDMVPRDPEQLDLELLVQAASAIVRHGDLPDYPSPAAPASA